MPSKHGAENFQTKIGQATAKKYYRETPPVEQEGRTREPEPSSQGTMVEAQKPLTLQEPPAGSEKKRGGLLPPKARGPEKKPKSPAGSIVGRLKASKKKTGLNETRSTDLRPEPLARREKGEKIEPEHRRESEATEGRISNTKKQAD